MAGNSQRRGARSGTGKKGASAGTGGKNRRSLAGRGATPPAEAPTAPVLTGSNITTPGPLAAG